ncbi:MAG: AgmX/PglI C-terminal domain-containing protein [Myxococcota bacterium]
MRQAEDNMSEQPTYRLVANGPPVSPAEVEAAQKAIEVVVMWGESVLQVTHVPEGGTFVIGEGNVDFRLGADILGSEQMALVEGGVINGATDGELELTRGEFRFRVRPVQAGKRIATTTSVDRRPFAYVGGALGIAGVLIVLGSLMPPASAALSMSNLDRESRLVSIFLAPNAIEEEEPEVTFADTGSAGEEGQRAAGDEGAAGDTNAPRTNNSYGVEGPEDNTDQHLARENVEQMARNAGVLGTLRTMAGSWNAPTSPFGRETALGDDPMNALGALMGDQIGANQGFGGLGLHGTGRGAGGLGRGTIGVGHLGTLGGTCDGECTEGGRGYGDGAGGLRRRRSRGPEVISRPVQIQGSLSREAIRRVISRHKNEIKFCYERALQSRPDLEGRVTTRFIIAPSGAVSVALVQQSTVGHQQTEQCITQAVRRWAFPNPDNGGAVSVTYPFVLRAQ